ncbi:MAG: hypothetical protein WCE38_16050, partial [Burkholderiales bacterium]
MEAMTGPTMIGKATIGKGGRIAAVAPQDGARYATVADGAPAHENDRGNPHCRCGAAAQRKET